MKPSKNEVVSRKSSKETLHEATPTFFLLKKGKSSEKCRKFVYPSAKFERPLAPPRNGGPPPTSFFMPRTTKLLRLTSKILSKTQ